MSFNRVRPLAVAVALLVVLPQAGQADDRASTATTVAPVRAKTVGEVSRERPAPGGAREVNPRRTHGRSAPSRGTATDRRGDASAALPSSSFERAPVPKLVVPGLGFTGAFPPDTVGEAGTQQYVQMVNDGNGGSRVGVFDKGTGAQLADFLLSSLAPEGHSCRDGAGDPIPIFDQYVNRWILTELVSPENPVPGVCMYVFSSANILTDSALLYRFVTPFFPDYPKWSVTSNAYYFSTNEQDGPAVYAIDRAKILLGQPAGPAIRGLAVPLLGFGFQALAPVDLDGPNAPPGNAPGVFIRHRDDEAHDAPGTSGDFLELFEFDPDFATPANSTFVGPVRIGISEFDSDLCGTFSLECIKQRATKRKLDPLREIVMHRALLRTFATHQSLVGTFVTNISSNKKNLAGVRWFELRRPAPASTGGWTLFQEGTVGSAGVSRWISSIAMNAAGDIALGYSAVGKRIFPSIRYTGRHASDPPGSMTQGETVMVAGTKSQRASSRWGDYSAMSVDPSDDSSFWYTNEISGRRSVWQTAIGSFTFD